MAGNKVVGSGGLRLWEGMGLDFVLYSEYDGEAGEALSGGVT